MVKKLVSVLAAAGLVAGALTTSTVTAQAAPEVPAEPNIVDPPGDANYINNNQTGGQSGNNHTTPADASSLGDILAVWFTHDAEKISVHVQTEAPQPSSGAAYIVFFYANPDECLFAEFAIAAPSYQGDSYAEVEDSCAELEPAEGEVISEEGPDGTGIITATFPRPYSPSFADGAVISAPRIEMRNLNGGPVSLRAPTIDNTDPGTDYTITGGVDTEEEPKEEPKKKKEKKGKKGKAKPKSAECAPFAPGEEGAEAPIGVVTDAHTAEAPLEVTVATEAGLPEADVTHVFQNIQVDTEAADSGLYAQLEFAFYEDYDIYLNLSDGTTVAQAAGFNPVPVDVPPVFNGNDNEHGGHTEMGAEFLDGVRTIDCEGYTMDVASYLAEGGELTLKLWLGEVTYEPTPE